MTRISVFALLRRCLSGGAAWFVAAAVLAGPGHDHGDEAPVAAATASPRVSGHSDLFELVGVVDRGVMTIYLDRYDSNEPVTGARIEVEAGAAKGVAQPQPDGSYRFEHAVLRAPGTLAVSFTVSDGKDADLLAGDLKLPDAHAGHDHDHAGDSLVWSHWVVYAGGALLLAVLALVTARAVGRRRHGATPVLVAAIVMACLAPATDALAGPGHDHGDETAAAAGNSPRRQSDGSVFLPKPSQRLLGVRTMVAEEKALPRTVELTGRVMVDPNAGGKVQPMQSGRVEPGPRGLPRLGQPVRKGEILAMVRAASAAIERANQLAQTAELKSALDQARQRVARLEQLEGMVARKDVEAARAEVDSLTQRLAAVGAGINATEALAAPASGVIAAVHVVAGQVVDAREVLFEIVDPARLMVEASAFDAALIGNIAAASASATPGATVALRFAGAGRMLREGAIPLQFSTTGSRDAPALAVGQPVKVIVQTRETVKGFAVPAGAVVKDPSNQDVVWVHTGAEVFQPRPVRAVALDGATLSVVGGLRAGDRVVTQGAPLVNQVR